MKGWSAGSLTFFNNISEISTQYESIYLTVKLIFTFNGYFLILDLRLKDFYK